MELYIKKIFSGRFSTRVLVMLLSMFSCVCMHSQEKKNIITNGFSDYGFCAYAMIVKYKDSDDCKVMELWLNDEYNAPNGYTYFYDNSCFTNRDFDEFQKYGFRIADKKIYVYDIEKEKEHVAYDYNIQPGESFTTMDGREWLVVDKQDTIFEVFYDDVKLFSDKFVKIKVCLASDRSVTDEWLENLGSLHYGIFNLHGDDIECSHVKYVIGFFKDDEENGNNLAYATFDFAEDPIYGGYYGWVADAEYIPEKGLVEGSTECKAEFRDGRLYVEFIINNDYNKNVYYTAYRNGNELKILYDVLPPDVDGDIVRTNIKLTFDGLPTGDLNLNIFGYDVGNVTSISSIKAQDEKRGGAIYDLTGRRVKSPEKGIYIQDGKKKLNK